jgi:hypothetical protein
MLFLNFFADGGVLLETSPQGDASTPIKIPDTAAARIAGLLSSSETSVALARLFLAGVTAGERAVRSRTA